MSEDLLFFIALIVTLPITIPVGKMLGEYQYQKWLDSVIIEQRCRNRPKLRPKARPWWVPELGCDYTTATHKANEIHYHDYWV